MADTYGSIHQSQLTLQHEAACTSQVELCRKGIYSTCSLRVSSLYLDTLLCNKMSISGLRL